MRYSFTGKNINIFDDVKDKAEKKMDRISKLVPEDTNVSVAISKNRHLFKVEVSMPLHKRVLRAEVTDTDIITCMDSIVDALEKQIIKYRGRLRERSRRKVATVEEETYMNELPEPADSQAVVIHRTKKFALKPMDPQDAVMEMELLGHSFFVFRSASSEEVNVVYRRNDGEYGLIEPQ